METRKKSYSGSEVAKSNHVEDELTGSNITETRSDQRVYTSSRKTVP